MEKHLSQGELAKILNINQTQLSRYERGISAPSLDILYKIEDALNCRLKDLYFLD